MPSREAEIADRLLRATDEEEASFAVIDDEPYDVDGLIAELMARADQLTECDRPDQAALVTFFAEFVEEQRERITAGWLPHDPPEEPDLDHAGPLLAASLAEGLLAKFLVLRRLLEDAPQDVDASRRWLPHLPIAYGRTFVETAIAAAFVFGDESERHDARVLWIAELWDRGAQTRARWHLERLRRLMPGEDDWQFRSALEEVCSHLLDRGNLDGAAELLTEALAISGLLELGIGAGQLGYRLAGALRGRGEIRKALAVIDRLDFNPARLGMMSQMYGTHELAARLRILRGLLLEDLGDYDGGRQSYETALQLGTAARNNELTFTASTYASASLMKAGRVRAGVHAARRTLNLAQSQPRQAFVPAALNNLAAALTAQGRPEAARSCYEQALALYRAHDTPVFGAAIAWFGLGDLAAARGDPIGAVDAYRHGWQAGNDAGHPRETAINLLGRAETIGKTGDLAPVVVDMVETSIDSDDWNLRTLAAGVRAPDLVEEGRPDDALALLRGLREEAVRRDAGLSLLARATCDLADLCLLVATPQSRQEAFDLLWDLRGRIDTQTAESLDAAGVHAALNQHRRVYERLLHLLLADGPPVTPPDGRTALELAFDLHEEAKARVFLAYLADSPLPAPPAVPPELATAEEALLAERRALVLDAAAEGTAPNTVIPRLRRLREELSTVYATMAPYAPVYARLRSGRPATLAHLRTHLPETDDVGFVSYFCGEAVTTVFTFTRRTNEVTAIQVPARRNDIEAVARALRRVFNGDPDAFPPLAPLHPRRPDRRDLGFFEELAPDLLAFLPAVHGATLLCVAPDGPISALPLHALVPPGSAEPLARRFAVTYLPSMSAALHVTSRAGAPAGDRRAIAFCAGVAAREDPDPEPYETDADLLVAAGWRVDEVHATQATPTAVLNGMRGYAVAHVTCHGHFDTAEPLDSGLLLADDTARPSKVVSETSVRARLRHVLTARAIAQERLELRLLVLRACSTAVTEYSDGDLGGVSPALLYAGVNRIVAPLWNVDRTSSRHFVAHLYRELDRRRDEPVWRVFWDAQRAMIEHPVNDFEEHLYHWAALVLMGDWR